MTALTARWTSPVHPNVAQIRDLRGVLDREKAAIGVLISLEPPTKPMEKEAAEAGFYESPRLAEKFPRIQILTIAQLLMGAQGALSSLARCYVQASTEIEARCRGADEPGGLIPIPGMGTALFPVFR